MSNLTDGVGYVSEPNGRGTVDLLWGSVLTIFICTYTALHLNVPSDDDSEWTVIWRKCKGMTFAIVAPEAITWLAVCDFLTLRETQQRVNELIEKPHEWTLTHGFFANMGGFTLQLSSDERYRLNGEQLCHLIETRRDLLPRVTRDEIFDKSKTDWVTKGISVLQIAWLIVQLVGRAAQHLEVALLELSTLATVVCAIANYGFWWHKPKDVGKPIVIRIEVNEITGIPGLMPELRRNYDHLWIRTTVWDSLDPTTQWPLWAIGIVFLVVAGFGACHLIGWHYAFVTHIEQLLWRISTIACIMLPLLFQLSASLDNGSGNRVPRWLMAYVYFVVIVIPTLLVRGYLLIEILISLRSVPPNL